MPLTETHIVLGFKKGDQRSETDIFNRFHQPLFYFALKLVGDAEEARDIITESFVKLWERRGSFSDLENIKAFLFVATRNACFNYLRNSKRKQASQKELIYLADEAVPAEEIRNIEIEAELLRLLMSEIDQLPRQCRTIFKMIHFNNMSTAEIADKLHIAKKTVLSQKARAISLLKTTLLKRKLLYLLLFIIDSKK